MRTDFINASKVVVTNGHLHCSLRVFLGKNIYLYSANSRVWTAALQVVSLLTATLSKVIMFLFLWTAWACQWFRSVKVSPSLRIHLGSFYLIFFCTRKVAERMQKMKLLPAFLPFQEFNSGFEYTHGLQFTCKPTTTLPLNTFQFTHLLTNKPHSRVNNSDFDISQGDDTGHYHTLNGGAELNSGGQEIV